MVEIEFDFKQSKTKIQANLDEPFQNILNKYKQKYSFISSSFFFFYNGSQIIDPSIKIKNLINDMDKRNKKMKILVDNIEQNNIDNNHNVIQSKDIVCPECKEPCRIKIENYKIKLYECVNNHITSNIRIKDFENTQKINESKIICNICKFENKSNFNKDEFFYCLTCKKNICLLCRNHHNFKHNIITYNHKNYICHLHKEPFIKYCSVCNKNICFTCQGHNNHNVIPLEELIPDINDKKKILKKMKILIDEVNSNIKDIIKQLTEFSEIIYKYYDIHKNIIDNYEVKNINYQVLENIKQINNNDIILNLLENIKDNKDIKNKFYDIINLYNKINENGIIEKEINKKIKNEEKNIVNNEKNEINIIYQTKNQNEITIFGFNFVRNNQNICHILIDNKKFGLCQTLRLNNKQKQLEIIKIKLINIKNITNMRDIFNGCNTLISLPDFSEWNTENVTDMSYIFRDCELLSSLPDISKWNTENVTNMRSMFWGCFLLSTLPDISKWDTKNETALSAMFAFCKSLISLPDISKWDTKKVAEIGGIFNSCNSLSSLPDISKWNTENVTDMNGMFAFCKSLSSLPDISNWATKNVTSMRTMFLNCYSLVSLPDISKWDTKNVTDMLYMFYGCRLLLVLPDISK